MRKKADDDDDDDDDDDEHLPFWLMGISICSPRMALWNPWSIPPFFFFFLLDFPDLGRSPSCALVSVRAFELLCSNQPHPMLVRDCELLPALEEDRADDEDDWARDSLESSPLDEAGRFLMMLLSDTFFCFCCAVLALASAAFLSAAFVAGSDSRAVDRSPPPTLMVLLLGVPPPPPSWAVLVPSIPSERLELVDETPEIFCSMLDRGGSSSTIWTRRDDVAAAAAAKSADWCSLLSSDGMMWG